MNECPAPVLCTLQQAKHHSREVNLQSLANENLKHTSSHFPKHNPDDCYDYQNGGVHPGEVTSLPQDKWRQINIHTRIQLRVTDHLLIT